MKQIYIYILAVAVAALTLTACANEDTEPDAGNVAPAFTATIEGGESRVIGCHWEPGDEIGISTNISTSTTSNVYNVCYATPNVDGEFTVKNVEEQIYYRSTTRTGQVTFNAYYPYKYISNPNTSTNRLIEVNTSEQRDQKSFDYLFATAKGTKDSPVVNLEFAHKMSKVTFIFKNGNDFNVSDISSCSLGNLYMTGKFNITSGAFSSLTNASTATVNLSEVEVKDGEPVTPLILIPQTVPGTGTGPRPVKLEIVSSDMQIYACDLSFPNNKLDAGDNYKFTITVNKTGLTISNCTIEDWIPKEDTGWGTGTAGSADAPDEE